MRLGLILMALMVLPAFGQNLMYGSSSIPDSNLPLSVPLEKMDQNKHHTGSYGGVIRVKIFPHTLKNDHLHGTRDIKTQVKLRGEGIVFNGKRVSALDLRYRN